VCAERVDDELSYTPPSSPSNAIDDARRTYSFVRSDKDELISRYLNGKRTLGSDHLSHLFFSSPFSITSLEESFSDPTHNEQKEEDIPEADQPIQFDIVIAATHYLGDGMALHNFATEFFVLLASQVGPCQLSLVDLLKAEWNKRCTKAAFESKQVLPLNLELRLPPPGGLCKRALAKGEFQNQQRKLIVCHCKVRPSLPR
jgi:hypothetical protein